MSLDRFHSLSLLIALVATLGIGCGGGDAQEGDSEQTAGGEDETVSLDAFAAELARQAGPGLCGASDAPLRACFEVTAPQCEEIFTVAITECARQLSGDLPAAIDGTNADSTAGAIAQCAGIAYRLGLDQNGLVRQTPECAGPAS